MTMLLKDLRLPVQEAVIYGFVSDEDGIPPGLSWTVEVLTEEVCLKLGFGDEAEEIFVDAKMSCEFVSEPLKSWRELEGKTVVCDSDKDFPAGISYFSEHELIPFAKLTFTKRNGNKFEIHWEGLCHPFLGESFERDVPFVITAEATFKELSVKTKSADKETIRHRLAAYLDPEDFVQHRIKENVHRIPNEYLGFFERWFRRLLGTPKMIVSRLSIFEPKK